MQSNHPCYSARNMNPTNKEHTMSETINTNVGVEGTVNQSDAADPQYDEIVKQLDGEGFAPSADQDDPDQQGDSEDDGEKITLKVNGKSVEHSFDEVKEMAQKYAATSMKLETAKREIEEARAVKTQLQSQQTAVRDLLGIMQRGEIDKISEFVHEKLGVGDVWDKAIIKEALRFWEIAKMSPEQREAIENRKLVQRLRAEAEERNKSEQQRAYEYQVNQWAEHINIEVPKAIKTVGLPDTAFIREHIISTWRAAIERGQTPTASAVANFVKKRLDEAKLTGQPMPQPSQRPKATRDSVRGGGSRSNGADTGYIGWDNWLKTRGK